MEDDTDYEFKFLSEYDFKILTEDSPQKTINDIKDRLDAAKHSILLGMYEKCLALGMDPDSFSLVDNSLEMVNETGYLNKLKYNFCIEIEKIIFINEKINYLKFIS